MWFFMFVVSIAINCSYTIYFACYCIALEGWEMMYILGLVEALVFSGLGWVLTCTSVSISGSNYFRDRELIKNNKNKMSE